MKFPAELVQVFSELAPATEDLGSPGHQATEGLRHGDPSSPDRSSKGRPESTGSNRLQDPVLRSAIENHAVEGALDHYRGLGGTDFVKLGKPYDLSLRLDGKLRHVEVKGSSMEVTSVELTVNEVDHARRFQPTDLVVMDQINWARDIEGGITTHGGRLRMWRDWAPAANDLQPQRFAYRLPPS